MSKKWHWLAAFVFLMALVLRVYHLGSQGLFLDEAWSWDAARLPLGDLFKLPLHDPHPVFYYLLLKISLWVLPATEAGLRALSAFFSLAAIVVLGAAAVRWWGWDAVFPVVLLAAMSPFDVYYAQEARMYTLLSAVVVLSACLLVFALDDHAEWLFPWGLSAALLPWIHAYGLLYLGAEISLLVLVGLTRYRKGALPALFLRRAVVGSIAAILGALPMMILFWTYRQGNAGGAWVPSWSDLWRFGGLLSVGFPAVRDYFLDGAHLIPPVLSSLSWVVWTIIGLAWFFVPPLIGYFSYKRDDEGNETVSLALLWIAVLPVLMAFGYARVLQNRMWAFKSLLGSAMLLYLFLSAGIIRVPRLFRVLWLGGCVLLSLNALWPYYHTWQKTVMPAAIEQINPSSEWALVLKPPYAAPVAYFYAGENIPLWGLTGKGKLVDVPSPFVSAFYAPPDGISCHTPAMQRVQEIWLLGAEPQTVLASYPCLEKVDLWWYSGGQWIKSP
ncbi:MAG: hypothetical protein D6694_13960 [Gammaproteobacteria bacterium]|nr:MAG: hypothetical protein D6694_13960 [Gammaproteobacteria bacterium]